MALASLPDGWEVWSDEPTRIVLAFRPDVFDSKSFPAPCLPTIYVTKGRPDRRPGRHEPAPDDDWYVTFFLEPDVSDDAVTAATRADAEAEAVDLAERFARGDIDPASLYQVPREAYLARLAELTGED